MDITMKKSFFVIAFLVSLFTISCEEKAPCVEKIKPDCNCILIYDPVCGCNNVTYGNSCQAECASITEYTKGECGS